MIRGNDFWSRRKARVEAEEQTEFRAAQDEVISNKSDAELCEDLGLPDPDAMQPGDDFSAFMTRAVPDRLRRRALRRLWLSNPALANVDGLVDYGQDFTDSATVVENLQTAYQVGRGMTAHIQEMARQAKIGRQVTPAAEGLDAVANDAEGHAVQAETAQVGDTSQDSPDQQVEPDAVASDEAINEPQPRRRMRFDFAEPACVDQTEVSA